MKRATYTQWQAMSQSERSDFLKENPRVGTGFLGVKVAELQARANERLHQHDQEPQDGGGQT